MQPEVPVSQETVFFKTDVFVTHAGLGAVQESLLGGVPLFCVPFLWDQPYLASIVERLGAGIRRFPRRLTQAQVRQACASCSIIRHGAQTCRRSQASCAHCNGRRRKRRGWIRSGTVKDTHASRLVPLALAKTGARGECPPTLVIEEGRCLLSWTLRPWKR
jgi:hypothetical protein